MKKEPDWFYDLNLKAAKHLVKLGVIKDWKKAYQNMTKTKKQRKVKKMTQIPMFQLPSEWTPPQNIPDLSQAKEILLI